MRTAAGVLQREDQIDEDFIEGVGARSSLTIIVARQREQRRLTRHTLFGEPQCALDQSPPAFLITAFYQHAIEHERRGNQAPHALRDTLLGSLNAAYVFLRKRFHDRPLRPHEVGDAVLEAASARISRLWAV